MTDFSRLSYLLAGTSDLAALPPRTVPYKRMMSINPRSGHPYSRQRHDTCIPKNDLQPISFESEHPALRLGSTSVPFRMDYTFKNLDALGEGSRFVRKHASPSSFVSRYSSDSSNSSLNSVRSANPSASKSNQHKTTNGSQGQSEQIRRSRESTTFALIDSALSKPPLGQIRDMHLQTKSSSNALSSTVPSRTTKKANLSVVHTVVRFRVEEYLIDLREHMHRLLDILFNSASSTYEASNKDHLSDLLGLSRLPCSSSCELCYRIGHRFDASRSLRRHDSCRQHLANIPPSVPNKYSASPNSVSSASLSSHVVNPQFSDCHGDPTDRSSPEILSERDESNLSDEATIPSSENVQDVTEFPFKVDHEDRRGADYVDGNYCSRPKVPPQTHSPNGFSISIHTLLSQ
ncbi:unnamed protein product, partial [Protopolystoma xenopodis]